MSAHDVVVVSEGSCVSDWGQVALDLLRSARLAARTGCLLFPRSADPTKQRRLPFEPERPARLGCLLYEEIACYLPTVALPTSMIGVMREVVRSRIADRALGALLACVEYAVEHPTGAVDRPVLLLAGLIAYADLLAASQASWCDLVTGWRPTKGGRTAAVEAIARAQVRDPQVQTLVRRVEARAWVRERMDSTEEFHRLEDDALHAVGAALESLASAVVEEDQAVLNTDVRPLRRAPPPPVVEGQDWLTVEQVGARLRQHPEVVRRRLRTGGLPGERLPGNGPWRVQVKDLDALMGEQARRRVARREDQKRQVDSRAWMAAEKAKRRK